MHVSPSVGGIPTVNSIVVVKVKGRAHYRPDPDVSVRVGLRVVTRVYWP